MDAVGFFDGVCARVLAARCEVCSALGGLFAFEITGEGGGRWTLDFARGSVTRELATNPTLTMQMSDADFGLFVRGALDVERALDEFRLIVSGDLDKLLHLSVIFEP